MPHVFIGMRHANYLCVWRKGGHGAKKRHCPLLISIRRGCVDSLGFYEAHYAVEFLAGGFA